VHAPKPVAAEPEPVAAKPVATEPEAAQQPVAKEPFPSAAAEPVTLPASAPPISLAAELDARLEPAHPFCAARPAKTAPGAANERVRDSAATVKIPEAGPPKAQPETAREAVPEPAAEPARVEEPPASRSEPEDAKDARVSFVDPSRESANWSASILQALARTSIGQKLEAERRGDDAGVGDGERIAGILQALARTSIGQKFEAEHPGERWTPPAGASPGKPPDAGETQGPEGTGSQST
jgi:hypothetical protein